jgi:uncharacterized protein
LRFTWDAEKNARNVRARKLAFEEASKIFDGPVAERVDDRFHYDEPRIHAIGMANGMLISVIYVDREPDERRIISAWRATPHDRRTYWEEICDRN